LEKTMQDYSALKRKNKLRSDWREIDAIRKAHIEAQISKPTKIEYSLTAAKASAPPKPTAQETLIPSKPVALNPGEIPKVPENWRDLSWPDVRDMAHALAGREPKSRAEARAIVAAHAPKGLV
jgi:hypothetical protein